ncbi:SHOCT domain-containing protein [Rathayibacter soli]|uniref:SHOCT domain-containing protein n=1 Tax=Rathayibacter soli TaxID=3144168 RepID=UPI0027E449A7|nr:SHOCT domain-containing protein [Glaciibacter superstes]
MIRHGFGGMVGMWPLMAVGMLLLAGIVVLIVLLIIRFARGDRSVMLQGGPQAAGPELSPARKILDERYARGDIDDEEYRRRRETLT